MTTKVNINFGQHDGQTSETAMAAAVAHRITVLRKARDLTFDALSRLAGVSKGTLVQIEQGRGNPSISTLCRLATSLGVSVADLVTPASVSQSKVSLLGPGGARKLWTGPQGGSAVLLAGTTGPEMLEMWHWEMKPGERFQASRHGRGTRELIHVTSGSLLLDIEDESTLIAAGSTAVALTDHVHAYSNPGKLPVRFFMTVHEPPTAP
jgi:DNA-binding XRE family transcriptional regulator/quercetin dioxygenase-like cupin family protein